MTTEERLARLEQEVFPEAPKIPFEVYWENLGSFVGMSAPTEEEWYKSLVGQAWNAALDWAAGRAERYRVDEGGRLGQGLIGGIHNKAARNIRDDIKAGKER